MTDNDNNGKIIPGALPYEHLTRQMDLLPIEKLDVPITIIGCGAVGSFTALSLAKMGFWNLTLYDHDKVDTVNLSCQFYRYTDIGENKAVALAGLIEDFTKERVLAVPEKWNGQPLKGIVITALDNMATRRAVFEKLSESPAVKVLIDPRMGAQEALCFVAEPAVARSMKRFANSLYSDAEAVEEPCTAKATMYCVLGIASHVCTVVRDVVMERPYAFSMTWAMHAYDHTAWTTVT